MIAIIIAALSGPLVMMILAVAYKIYSTRKRMEPTRSEIKPFVVSEYFSRMERAALDILEDQETVDQTVTLWWGLDGLRLNEDGTTEWVSRKKPAETVFYQPCQSIQADVESQLRLHSQTQSTRAQIEELMMKNAALQNQAAQNMQNAAIIGMLPPPVMPGYIGYSPYLQSAFAPPLQQCCVQYPAQYPSYYYGGCCRIN